MKRRRRKSGRANACASPADVCCLPSASPRELIMARIACTVRLAARIDAGTLAGLLENLDLKTDRELLAWDDRIQLLSRPHLAARCEAVGR